MNNPTNRKYFHIQYYGLGHSTMILRSLREHYNQEHRVYILIKDVKNICLPVRFWSDDYTISSHDGDGIRPDKIEFHENGKLVGYVEMGEISVSIDTESMDAATSIEELNILMRLIK